MNALERRMQIAERMKIRKFDTAFSLAADFGVSHKTILRDVQELSCSGYAIQADVGGGGGIRWLGNKRDFPFTERQMLALKNASEDKATPEDRLVLADMLRDKTPPKPEITNNDIFEFLRDGKSQNALARELGISGTLLSLVLSGRRKPSAELAERISKLREGGFLDETAGKKDA